MNWEGLSKELIQLKLPLLIIKGSRGFISCGYINLEVCNQIGDACGIVRGVLTHEDMLEAELTAVSQEGERQGLQIGMKGREALENLR